MTDSVTAVLAARMETLLARVPDPRPAAAGRIISYDGVLMEAVGFIAPTGALCMIADDSGDHAAEVIGFRGEKLLLMSLAAGRHVSPGARVAPVSSEPEIPIGDALLGRVIDGRGQPIDSGEPIGCESRWPLRGKPRPPLDHMSVTRPLDVGVRAINALLTVGRGQRIGIAAGSGVGKSVLLGMIARYTEADIVVIGLIGERGREVSDFVAQHISGENRARTVVVAVPANDSPLLRLRGAERATAIAESFRAIGKSVLLIIDSLTRVAHAQREIGLALGEPPTSKGYPPSVFSLIPTLVERAGASPGGGSITAVYTVLADGDDVDGDPVVDSARAILDGHIVLSRKIAERGIYPAIDLAKSVSRVMQDIVTSEQLRDARKLRLLNSVFEQNADLVMLGAYKAGQNPELDEAILRRGDFEAFMSQDLADRVGFEAAAAALGVAAGSR